MPEYWFQSTASTTYRWDYYPDTRSYGNYGINILFPDPSELMLAYWTGKGREVIRGLSKEEQQEFVKFMVSSKDIRIGNRLLIELYENNPKDALVIWRKSKEENAF